MSKKSKETKKQRTQRIKAAWVAALRSGRYLQGPQQLRIADNPAAVQFCCMGVLCDLYAKEHEDRSFWSERVGLGREPAKVCKWFGRNSEAQHDAFDKFVRANDAGKTFAEVADMIEETDFSA